jgi:hypothetical protein
MVLEYKMIPGDVFHVVLVPAGNKTPQRVPYAVPVPYPSGKPAPVLKQPNSDEILIKVNPEAVKNAAKATTISATLILLYELLAEWGWILLL